MPGWLLLLHAGAASGGGGTPPPATALPLFAETNETGDEFTVTFSIPVEGFDPGDNGFVLTGQGIGDYFISYSSGDGTDTITFGLSFIIPTNGVVLTLSYTPGDINAVGGGPLAPFSNFPVTNNVPPVEVVSAFRSLLGLPLSRVRTVHV